MALTLQPAQSLTQSPRQMSPPPLQPEQLEAIVRARQQAKKILRAATVASVSGWSCFALATLTLLSGIFSTPALLLGAGMMGVALVEINGSRSLRHFQLTAPRRLALNQITLMVILIAYCAWQIYQSITGPNPFTPYLEGGDEVARMLEPIARLQSRITLFLYAAVIAGTVVGQGLMALYYFSRGWALRNYLSSTPAWTVQALRAAA